MDEQKPAGKPLEIPKQEVWDAWLKVKANGGAPGAEGQSIEDLEASLKSNLYKVWNGCPRAAISRPGESGGDTESAWRWSGFSEFPLCGQSAQT